MAYDSNSTYEPPRRAYYGQPQQQAPVQHGHRNQSQEEYGGYGQQYDQNQVYDQRPYGQQQQGYTRDVSQPQEQSYSDGYAGGYQRQQRPRPPPQQQQQERSYDPRYQQRPGRSPPRGNGEHPGQRAQQQLLLQEQQIRQEPHQQRLPPQRQEYDTQAREQQMHANPRNGYAQPRQQDRRAEQSQSAPQQRPLYEQQPSSAVSLPRAQASGAPPQSAPAAAPRKQEPKKMTMEEWKAQERAKMHAAAMSPESLAQDNAFPVFPTKKERLRPDDRSGGASSMSHRSSGEARSSTSSAPQQIDHGHDQRPSISRDNSYGRDAPQQQDRHAALPPVPSHGREASPQHNGQLAPQRPPLDRMPFSFEPVPKPDEQHYASQQQVQQQRPPAQRQPSDPRLPVQQANTPQQQQSRAVQPREQLRSSPPANDYRQPSPQSHQIQHDQDYPRQRPPQAAQQAEYTRAGGRPHMQPIDTAQSRQQQPSYMDHQPLSPAYVPPRPSTAQGARGARASPGPQVSSPLSYSQTPNGYDGDESVHTSGKPWAQQDQVPRHGSLGDVYDGQNDYSHEPTIRAPQRTRTRDEEIEEEMPDFDSAAPSQTSLLHKRNQTVEKHLSGAQAATVSPPPMPAVATQHTNQSTQSLDGPNARSHQQQQPNDVYRNMAQRKQAPIASRPAPTTNGSGFDFGALQQQPPQQYDDRYQQSPQQYQQQQGMPYQQQALPVQPPQPPFAHEPPPRRSMDDARQMPYRQGPPQPQRFHANGQPLRGPLPPMQRPEVDRNGSGQTVQTMYSDPGAQRVPNVHASRGPLAPPHRPEVDRNGSGQTVQTMYSDPGAQRVPSAPPLRQGLQEPPGRPSANGVPLTQQRSAPEAQYRHSNPDALPQHPTPVRPGLMEGGVAQPAKPPPIRNYDAAGSMSSATSHARQASVSATPVTHAELDQLRAAVSANPGSNKQALLFAKKLVEAATVLASEGGRADPKKTAKNREMYILDAHKRIKKLVSAGYPDAQFYLADCYGQGSLGLEVDTKEAFNLYQAAAKAGHPQAAYRTAVCCEMGPEEGGGTRKDPAKAVQWYRRAAALGDVAAMYKLGIVLLKGLMGQPRNVGEAVTWLKRAAERADRDNPHALHELGTLYEPLNTDPEVRNKVIADENYARELYQDAAKLGYKFSQFRLGQAYEYGTLALPIDNRASIAWYSKAAAQGEHQAELALSGWYLTGAEGILEHSDTEAYLWARKAAQSEPPLAKAMFAMGYFSEMGIGCPANMEEARRWYGRAASYKFPKAMERLEELKRNGKSRPTPANGKLTRKDQKKDEAECAVM